MYVFQLMSDEMNIIKSINELSPRNGIHLSESRKSYTTLNTGGIHENYSQCNKLTILEEKYERNNSTDAKSTCYSPFSG